MHARLWRVSQAPPFAAPIAAFEDGVASAQKSFNRDGFDTSLRERCREAPLCVVSDAGHDETSRCELVVGHYSSDLGYSGQTLGFRCERVVLRLWTSS